MNPLDLVRLTELMEKGSGSSAIHIGLIDGPIAMDHPQLTLENIREIYGRRTARCDRVDSSACVHGTFVAGILGARRGTPAPAICPQCTLLVRPLFTETVVPGDQPPNATPQELAAAILDCIAAGTRVINLSLALARPSMRGERELEQALDYAARREVLVVAAAGNQGTIGSSCITRHPWVVPVVACDRKGMPTADSNLAGSIGRRGLSAPGDAITSLGPAGGPITAGGTSVATPFVTGAAALLWSAVPNAGAARIKSALVRPSLARRPAIVPALLDAWGAYQYLTDAHR
jgi:subtilisin family serine protease